MAAIKQKYEALKPEMDERGRRIWAATEAMSLGHGGITLLSQATGMAVSTIRAGQAEIRKGKPGPSPNGKRRVRSPGAGRKPITERDGEIAEALDRLVEPEARGDPMSPLRWTSKSTRTLAAELTRQNHPVSHTKVAQMLESMGYRLQGTRKTREGCDHPDRDRQFAHINEQVMRFQERGQPVISVDTKKKELVGEFANKGREYQPKGCPEKVRVHDFMDLELGKAIPYGVYDVSSNSGWVSVGIDHDTSQFAVNSIRQWWERMGVQVYKEAKELLITADGGGSNGSRSRLWKVELQRLADETGLAIAVCHLPPGTSKWNKIEHRMFCHITENWRGRPLRSHEVIVNLIAGTKTRKGLRIQAELDQGTYPPGVKVTDVDFGKLNIQPAEFHGQDWNYTIAPRREYDD